ncbi:MAG: hypothetical protein LC107_10455 [Chitinophagales bacterium]|nr:hypothetical protein [Chitinophagales bacterium]
MSQETQNTPKSADEEVDIIRLFNYFKQGIVSLFKQFGRIFNYVILLLILIKKQWMIVGGMILLGAIYGAFVNPLLEGSEIKYYEMTVRSGAVSNLELYAFASEVKHQKASSANAQSKGIQLAKELGIISLQIDPIIRTEDVTNNYFDLIESNQLRGSESDTMYFKAIKLKDHMSSMENTDYALQKLRIKTKPTANSPKDIQDKLLDYFNNLPGVQADQQIRIATTEVYEREISRTVGNIDSLLNSRILANRQDVALGGSQMVFNANNKDNVEKDLLKSFELYSKKLYRIQKYKAQYPKAVNIVTNLRSGKEQDLIINPVIHYALLGFLGSILVILGIRFNRYLDQYAKNNIV